MKQEPHKSNKHHMDNFKSNITAIELTKGDHIFYSPGLTGVEKSSAKSANIQAKEERNKAIILLLNADKNRYKGLSDELRKNALLDRNEYPTTVANMYEVMVKYDSKSGMSTSRNNNS